MFLFDMVISHKYKIRSGYFSNKSSDLEYVDFLFRVYAYISVLCGAENLLLVSGF